jgi:hypothetical protein
VSHACEVALSSLVVSCGALEACPPWVFLRPRRGQRDLELSLSLARDEGPEDVEVVVVQLGVMLRDHRPDDEAIRPFPSSRSFLCFPFVESIYRTAPV